jgi:hypothetical protein
MLYATCDTAVLNGSEHILSLHYHNHQILGSKASGRLKSCTHPSSGLQYCRSSLATFSPTSLNVTLQLSFEPPYIPPRDDHVTWRFYKRAKEVPALA